MLRRIPHLLDNAPKPWHMHKEVFLCGWAQAVISWLKSFIFSCFYYTNMREEIHRKDEEGVG